MGTVGGMPVRRDQAGPACGEDRGRSVWLAVSEEVLAIGYSSSRRREEVQNSSETGLD